MTAHRLAAFVIPILLVGCGGLAHLPLVETIKESRTDPADTGEPVWFVNLKEVDTVQVQTADGRSFNVLARMRELTHMPCRNCHLDTFTLTPDAKSASDRRSHRDIELKHAPPDVMTCATCHHYGDVDFLRKPNGAAVSFDRADQVCRSCHFQQNKDWVGGAHGKRHAFWQGPRVIRNCTGCHNPHTPAFEKRWPVTHPSVPRRYE